MDLLTGAHTEECVVNSSEAGHDASLLVRPLCSLDCLAVILLNYDYDSRNETDSVILSGGCLVAVGGTGRR